MTERIVMRPAIIRRETDSPPSELETTVERCIVLLEKVGCSYVDRGPEHTAWQAAKLREVARLAMAQAAQLEER